MYFGINIAKIMAESAFTNKPPVAQLEVLQRSKNYLVTLAKVPQKRLPINQLMKDLQMLNARVVISGDISTYLHQDLDAQWRQLPLTSEIVGMVTGSNGEIFSTTKFWVKLGKIEEFSFVLTLATKLLSLSVSNIACERIFS